MTTKTEQAIRFLKQIPEGEDLFFAHSGGKDSVVCYDLIKRAGIKCSYKYNNTTIDPPKTIQFLKTNYPDVQIVNPPKSFFKLIEERGLPTRVGRFCCDELKERSGIGKRIIEGVRAAESTTRKQYEPEQCDTRKKMKGAKHYFPILNWSDKEVWQYIRENNIPYMIYYDSPYNFKRHGCVGCPLAGGKQQLKEFRIFPRYFYATLRAIKKRLDKKLENKFCRSFNDEYEAFYWWISGISLDEFVRDKERLLFPIDYKTAVLESIKSR